MPTFREIIKVEAEGNCGVRDITPLVSEAVAKSGLKQGICCVSVTGSTGGISTIEFEPGLLKDIPDFMEKLIPSNIPYEHDKTWGDGNGFSHLRSFLIGSSKSYPFNNAVLDLGTWQQIIVINFDNKSRSREVIVQLVGE